MQQKTHDVLTKNLFLRELKKLATKDELKKLSQRMDSFEKSIRNEFSAHKIAIELKLDEHEDKAEASRQKFYSKIYDLVANRELRF